MTESIIEFFSIFPDWLHVLFISAIPVVELRGSIPYGILLLGMPYFSVLIYAIVGSIIPSPFIIYLGEAILTKLEQAKSKRVSSLAIRFRESRIRKSGKIEKYSYLGLILFVAIPLPGTGVWTGSIIAALLKLNPLKAIGCVLIGTTIAGIIVTLLVQTGVLLVSA